MNLNIKGVAILNIAARTKKSPNIALGKGAARSSVRVTNDRRVDRGGEKDSQPEQLGNTSINWEQPRRQLDGASPCVFLFSFKRRKASRTISC